MIKNHDRFLVGIFGERIKSDLSPEYKFHNAVKLLSEHKGINHGTIKGEVKVFC